MATSPAPRRPPPNAATFDREAFSQRFLSVSRRLEALQPPAPAPPSTPIGRSRDAAATTDPSSSRSSNGDSRLVALLASPALAYDVFRRNEVFRPCERVASVTNAQPGVANHDDAGSPTKPQLATARRPSKPDSDAKKPPTATRARGHMYVAVGGKARILASDQLARVKAALHARSNALANLHPAAGASPELRKAMRAAPGSTWEALRNAAAVAGSLAEPPASDNSAAASASKQALVAELVQRTNFSTLDIFQMSRKFKAIAGSAKSVITFEEFGQIMSDDMKELLGGIDVGSGEAASGSGDGHSTSELTAIGATIAASDTFLRRLFIAFDRDGDGRIDIREFVVGLNGFVRGAPEDKVAALFEIYKSDTNSSRKGPPTVAISDLLGLFQGDRQLYQELMRCVDDYFVRVELREENVISEDEFVSTSLEEPHLLDNISRPLPSRRYSSDARVRELVRAFIEQSRLNWRELLQIHRRLIRWARQQRRVDASRQQDRDTQDTPSISSEDLQAIVLPAADFQDILRGEYRESIRLLDTKARVQHTEARPSSDDASLQNLLLAYLATPRDKRGTAASRMQGTHCGVFVDSKALLRA